MIATRLAHLVEYRVDRPQGAAPYLALEHLEGWTGRLFSGVALEETEPSAAGQAAVRKGDVLFGKLRPYLAKSYLVERSLLASTELICLRPAGHIDSRWLGYLVRSKPFVEWSVATSAGAKMPRTSWEKLRDYRVRVPTVEEQRAIADYLDRETTRIDALIAKKQRLVELVRERWIGEVFKSCIGGSSTTPLIALRHLVGGVIGGAWGSDQGGGEVDALCVRGTDFNTRELLVDVDSAPVRGLGWAEYKSRALVPGDLVIEKSGGGAKQPVGRVVQWQGGSDAVPTNFAARLRPNRGVHSRWLTYVFRAAYEAGQTRAWLNQTTGIQNLDLDGFLTEKWPVPSLQSQTTSAAELDSATESSQIIDSKLCRQINLLQERREALVTAAMTGELEVAA
jgi:type I restriction enzyme, S subunit